MKIKHSVELEQHELAALTKPFEDVYVTTYSSLAEQEAALHLVKEQFNKQLEHYLHKAFSFGEMIGKAGADTKDTMMYSD